MLSIQEAKETLGAEYTHCTDEEIEKIRDAAYMFADIFVEGFLDARKVLPTK